MVNPDQSCFIRVPVKCIEGIVRYLRHNGFPHEASAVEKFSFDYTDEEANKKRLEWVERAIADVHEDGEIEFDTDATISHSEEDGGQYVLGWVWVYGPDEYETSMTPDVVEAVANILGRNVDREDLLDAIEDYVGNDTPWLAGLLGEKERLFDLDGGRGVDLAEEIDRIRMVLAYRAVGVKHDK